MIEQINDTKRIHVYGLAFVPEIILKTLNAVEAKERVPSSVIDDITTGLDNTMEHGFSMTSLVKYENIFVCLSKHKIFHILVDHKSEKTPEIVKNLNSYNINVLYYKNDHNWGYLCFCKGELTYVNVMLDAKVSTSLVDPVQTILVDDIEWVQETPLFLSPHMSLHLSRGGLVRMVEDSSRTMLQMVDNRGNPINDKEECYQYMTDHQVPRQVVSKTSDVVIIKDSTDHAKIAAFLEAGLVPVVRIQGTWYYYHVVVSNIRYSTLSKEMMDLNGLTNQ